MDYDDIELLRSRHPAWGLVSSRNAALVLAFLGRVLGLLQVWLTSLTPDVVGREGCPHAQEVPSGVQA